MRTLFFSLSLLLCTSTILGQQTLLSEDFGGQTWPPAGWSLTVGGNDPGWTTNYREAVHYDYTSVETNELITPEIPLSNIQTLTFSFTNVQINSLKRGKNLVMATTDGGQIWHMVYDEVASTDGVNQINLDLSSFASSAKIQLAFRYIGPQGGSSGNLWKLDDVLLTATSGGGGNGIDAYFGFAPGIGNAPLDVQFTDLSTGSPDSYLWNFGDGSSSTDVNPMHTFTQAGSYYPSLTLFSSPGVPASTYVSPNVITVNTPSGGSGNQGSGGGEWNDLGGEGGAIDGGGLGGAVANLRDLDGDGICDYAVGAPYATDSNGLVVGEVYVYSAASGSLLYQLSGFSMDSEFGASISRADDANQDGVLEILVGAPNDNGGCGGAYLFSGADGAFLHSFGGVAVGDAFGDHVGKAGDANQDGVKDLLIGAPGEDSGGSIDNGAMYCFDAVTGTQLYRVEGPPQALTGFLAGAGPGLGTTTATISDVNSDTVNDLIVGVPWADVTTTSGLQVDAGMALVIDGATGDTLLTLKDTVPQTSDFYGMSVAQAPDVDEDGFLDFAVGVAGEEIHTLAGGVMNDAGKIVVYSGSTGTVITEIPGTRENGQTGSNVTVGDANGDGVPDLVSGGKSEQAGITTPEFLHVDVYDTMGGGLIWTQEGAQGSRMGSAVAFICDKDGDGRDDFIVGSPGFDSGGMTDNGAFTAHGYDSYMWTSDVHVGASNGFTVQWEFDFPSAHAGQRYRVLASLSGTGPTDIMGVTVPLTQDNLFWQTLFGIYPMPSAQFSGHLDAQGNVDIVLNASAASASNWAGTQIWASCLVFDQRLPVVASGYVPLWIH